jgi:hypothetical protein
VNKKFISLESYGNIFGNADNCITIKDSIDLDKGLVIRHDIDESLELALILYELEKSIGIRSTFHILLTSDLYNPFSKKNKEIIQRINSDGFEIGLHFDPLAYLGCNNVVCKLEEEIDIFENFFGFKLYSYSIHRPSVCGQMPYTKKLLNAYSERLFREDNYMSDSMFSFKNKNIEEYVAKSRESLVQILIHPCHLISDGKISYEPMLTQLVNGYIGSIDDVFSENRIYKEQREQYKIEIKRK